MGCKMEVLKVDNDDEQRVFSNISVCDFDAGLSTGIAGWMDAHFGPMA